MNKNKFDEIITRNEIEQIAHFIAQKCVSLEAGTPKSITQKYIDAYLEAKQTIVDHNINVDQ